MRKRYLLGLILSLIPLPIIISYLNSKNFLTAITSKPLIDWQLAVTLVIVEVPIGLLFHFLAKDKKESKTERRETRYDIKKINNEVFKKLIYLVCLEHYQFFENKFGFCIAKDSNLFLNINQADLAFNIHYNKLSDIENLVDKLEDVIPTIEVGEDYLQKNYQPIYDSWIQIKQELDEINKDRQDFCNKVSEKIMNDLKKQIKMNPTFLLDPFGDGWAYFYDNMSKIIPTLFNKFGQIDFKIESPIHNQYYLSYGGYNLMGSNKKERLDSEMIKQIFENIHRDNKFEKNHTDFQYRLIKLNNKIESFCKRLEKKVVNDIDNQV